MPKRLALSEFKAVLFDVDGTLVDSLPALIPGLGDTFERYTGIRPRPEEVRSVIGMPLRNQLKLFGLGDASDEQVEEMTSFALHRFDSYMHLERVYEPAVETLRACHFSGLRTALVTSKNAEELRRFLPRFPGAEWVDATVCASDVDQPKPNPESALLACERLGVDPSESVMIGDSIYDMRCARDAGVAVVAVAYGSGGRNALAEEQPDLLFGTPDELLAWACESLAETPCRERRR